MLRMMMMLTVVGALCNRSDTALRVDISEQEGRDCLIERI